jgi:ABC-type dipeptide/oligopeptide/nickel transport system permease subunit
MTVQLTLDESVPPVKVSSNRQSIITARRLWATGSGRAGAVIVGAFVAMALFAPELSPHSPLTAYTSYPLAGPSLRFPLGTDSIGRDLLSRLIYGTRPALFVGVVAVGLAALIGVSFGIIAGYFGGIFDALTSRIWDAVFGIPVIILAGAVVLAFGESVTAVAVAVAIGVAPGFARLARAGTLGERSHTYVEACRSLGFPHRRILARHILPNVIGPLIVAAAFAMSVAAILQATLSFLGIGVQPPAPQWGSMMQDGMNYLKQVPLYSVMPGVFLTVLAIGLNLLGEGLRKALSVRESVL